jgi:iron(III) transport system permease protein
MAGFFIAFILSLGELGTTLLVIPPGRETIPIKIYNLMHYGADQLVAALCLILIVIPESCTVNI